HEGAAVAAQPGSPIELLAGPLLEALGPLAGRLLGQLTLLPRRVSRLAHWTSSLMESITLLLFPKALFIPNAPRTPSSTARIRKTPPSASQGSQELVPNRRGP